MRKPARNDADQTAQRVKVGVTGLAAVLLLIGAASAVFRSADREPPIAAVGAPQASVVANLSNTADDSAAPNEPLAELGVAPSATTNDTDASTKPSAGEAPQ